MPGFPEHLTIERLSLHRWDTKRHTSALAAINAQPQAVTYLNDGVPYTPDQSRAQSERFAAHWDTHGFGLWALETPAGIVGFAGACHPQWFPAYAHEVEVGWRLHPSAWGNGYATDAGRAAVAAAFDSLELERVIACIDPGNLASIAVAERLGMTLAERTEHPQRPGSLLIFAIEPGTS